MLEMPGLRQVPETRTCFKGATEFKTQRLTEADKWAKLPSEHPSLSAPPSGLSDLKQTHSLGVQPPPQQRCLRGSCPQKQ